MDMASRRSAQLLLNRINKGIRSSFRCFGTVSDTASSRHLIGLEHDYSAHKYALFNSTNYSFCVFYSSNHIESDFLCGLHVQLNYFLCM